MLQWFNNATMFQSFNASIIINASTLQFFIKNNSVGSRTYGLSRRNQQTSPRVKGWGKKKKGPADEHWPLRTCCCTLRSAIRLFCTYVRIVELSYCRIVFRYTIVYRPVLHRTGSVVPSPLIRAHFADLFQGDFHRDMSTGTLDEFNLSSGSESLKVSPKCLSYDLIFSWNFQLNFCPPQQWSNRSKEEILYPNQEATWKRNGCNQSCSSHDPDTTTLIWLKLSEALLKHETSKHSKWVTLTFFSCYSCSEMHSDLKRIYDSCVSTVSAQRVPLIIFGILK